jgi:hypothetical protein
VTTTWHAEDDLLARYAAWALDDARAFSLEAHLLSCAACRESLADTTDATRLEHMWSGVVEIIDAPRPGVVERGLLRLGVRDHVARVLAATPSLRLSWFAAEAVALGFAVGAARAAAGGPRAEIALLLFLVVAALLPVAGVAVSFGPGMDPTYEVGVAAPLRGSRLFLLRAIAVLTTSTVFAAVAALALPGLDWTAAAWLLPSLGLSLATLTLSTYVRPLYAGGVVTLGWVSVATSAAVGLQDRLIVFRGGGQIVFLVVVAVSAAVLARRRQAFERGVSG